MYSFKYIVAKVLRKVLNPPAVTNSQIDRTARCDIGCSVSNSKMGRYSYIGEYTSLSRVEVGDFTSISGGCTIGGGSHPTQWVSTSPVFTSGKSILGAHFAFHEFTTHQPTFIGNDVWIGSNCVIKSGVHIGDGAVIGMGSVVTHDVGSYEIWVGVPAKMLRKRFPDDVAEQLSRIAWWEWSEERIRESVDSFNSVDDFLKKNQ